MPFQIFLVILGIIGALCVCCESHARVRSKRNVRRKKQNKIIPEDTNKTTPTPNKQTIIYISLHAMEVSPASIFAHRKDLHKLLGVQKGCTEAEIKRSYRRLALRFHPDKYEKGVTQHSEVDHLEAFRLICRAQEILLDDKKRSVYELGGMDDVDKFESRGEVGVPSLKEAIQMISLVCLVFATREGFRNVRRANNPHPEMDVPLGDAEARRRSRGTRRQEMQCTYSQIVRVFRVLQLLLILIVGIALMGQAKKHVEETCQLASGWTDCLFSLAKAPFVDSDAGRRAKITYNLFRRGRISADKYPGEMGIILSRDEARWSIATSKNFDSFRVTLNSSLFRRAAAGPNGSSAQPALSNFSLLMNSESGHSHGPYLNHDGVPFYSTHNIDDRAVAYGVTFSAGRVRWVGEEYCEQIESVLRTSIVMRSSSDQFGRRWGKSQKVCSDSECRRMVRRPIRLRRIQSTVESLAATLPPASPFCDWWHKHASSYSQATIQ